MSKTEITSKNQSGGITAQNVSIQGNNIQNVAEVNRSPEERKPLKRVWKIITAIVFFLAALVAVLEYFNISPF